MVEQYNYLEVYPYDKWSDKNIPKFKPNETFIPTTCFMREGETTPPNLISETELITIMDKQGIGIVQ